MNTARGEAGRIHDQAKNGAITRDCDQALEDISQDIAGIQAAMTDGAGLENSNAR